MSFRRLLAEKAAFVLPVAAVLSITIAARFGNTEVFGAVPGLRELPLSSRIAQSAYVAAYYVWKPWWPLHLSPLYDTLMDFRPLGPPFVASMALVAAASALALHWFRRRPAFAVVWFGYLSSAAPFFGLTEKPHMASDRYGYFLTALMACVLAAALARVRAPRARVCAALLSLAAIGVLGRLSWRQLEVWSDDRLPARLRGRAPDQRRAPGRLQQPAADPRVHARATRGRPPRPSPRGSPATPPARASSRRPRSSRTSGA